jgi:ABC-type dipeptide/oligopeptide/nickel transport system permease component
LTSPFSNRLLSNLITLVVVVLAGGFLAAALVRYSPGFDSIPEDLNPAVSPETLRALHQQHDRENVLPVFYARYLARAIRGDFGFSQNLKQPVTELLRQRIPVTARLIFWGTVGGWLLGGALAWMAVWTRRTGLEAAAFSLSGFFLAIPPAVLALAFFFYQAPLAPALSLALLPRIFGTLRVFLEDCYSSPALLAARSRGVGPFVIAARYVVFAITPQLIALFGAGLMLAFGLAIPIEALCGVPGLGALALEGAVSRDMPLLCGMALIVTLLVTLVHAVGDVATGFAGEHA